jgi:hypothetical protein
LYICTYDSFGQEAAMAVTPDKPVPYAPASAILEVVDRFRNRGLQSPINAEVLGRIGISESLIPRTLQALRTLDLIDEDGKPTATLDGLRLATEADFKKNLEGWMKSAYAPVFSFVDPAKDGETRIRDAFRGYNPAAQQSRMVTLFTGLCAAAGLIAEKAVPTPRNHAPRPASPAARPAATSQARTRNAGHPAQAAKRATASVNAYGLPPAIAGLVESLPSPEEGWTAAERDRFLTTFKAVLDFAIPVVTKKAPLKEADDEAA